MDINIKKILIIAGLIFSVWFVYEIRSVLTLLFVAFILLSALRPLVLRMVNNKIPKPLAIIIVFLGLVIVLVLGLVALLPPFIRETVALIRSLPDYLAPLLESFNMTTADLAPQLTTVSSGLIKATVTIFSDVISFVALIVLTLYMLLERDHIKKDLEQYVSKERAEKIVEIVEKIEARLGSWVNGQMVLCVTIGLFSYIGLRLLGIQYALPLAILAGIFEILPTIGSIVASIPAILLGFTISPVMATAVAALYLLIHQSENHLIVPLVMKKAVGLPPLVTIIALMIGGKIAGIPGALLAIPFLVTIQTIVESVKQNSF